MCRWGVKARRFSDCKTVGVEARGCEQLAQSRCARPRIELEPQFYHHGAARASCVVRGRSYRCSHAPPASILSPHQQHQQPATLNETSTLQPCTTHRRIAGDRPSVGRSLGRPVCWEQITLSVGRHVVLSRAAAVTSVTGYLPSDICPGQR